MHAVRQCTQVLLLRKLKMESFVIFTTVAIPMTAIVVASPFVQKWLWTISTISSTKNHSLLKTKELFLNDEDDDIKKHYKGDLKQIEEGLQNIEGTIEKQKEHIKKGQGGILTYEEFLELMEKTGQIMHKIKNMGELDYLCRKLYMNFTTDGKNIISATLSAPFNELYQAKVSQGGPQETRTPYPLIANEVLYQMSWGPLFYL